MTLDRKKVGVFNRNFRENRYMADIYIFDIDGCIMPNLFQNFKEFKDDSEIPNFQIKDKVANLHIFPEFLDFYKRNCSNSLAVYFITGRKRTEYGEITERQLNPLKKSKRFFLKFYPENKSHFKKDYFDWKYNIITRIINYHLREFENIYIYDDFEDIISRLRDTTSLNHQVHCSLIQKQTDWILKQIQIF